MRKLENVVMVWCLVATVGMFIAVGGMHKLDLWGPSCAINLILAAHVVAMLAAVYVAKRD